MSPATAALALRITGGIAAGALIALAGYSAVDALSQHDVVAPEGHYGRPASLILDASGTVSIRIDPGVAEVIVRASARTGLTTAVFRSWLAGPARHVSATCAGQGAGSCTADLAVRLPPGIAVSARGQAREIRAEGPATDLVLAYPAMAGAVPAPAPGGIATPLALSTDSGNIVAESWHGDVSAVSASGDIELRGTQGSITTRNHSGNTSVVFAGGDFSALSASGDVRAASVTGSCDVRASSGDVSLDAIGKDVSVRTTSGDIDVLAPAGTPAVRLLATSASGHVDAAGPANPAASISVTLSSTSGNVTYARAWDQ